MPKIHPIQPAGEAVSAPKSRFICSQAVKSPRKTFALAVGGHGLGMLITLIAWACNYNMFPTYWDPRWSFRGKDNLYTDRDAAWESLVTDPKNNQWARTLFPQVEREVNFASEALEVIYEGSCYTPANLASMKKLEDQLFATTQYQKSMCWKQDRGGDTCRLPKSPLRLFDGTFEDLWPIENGGQKVFRADPTFSRIDEITRYAWLADGDISDTNSEVYIAGNPDIRKYSNYITGREFQVGQSDKPVDCRTLFYMGFPLNGFANIEDQLSSQVEQMQRMQVESFKSQLESNNRVGTLSARWSSPGLSQDAYRDDRIKTNLLCMGGGLVFLFGYMLITKSVVLPIGASFGMAGTYFWANLLYRYVFQFYWWSMPQQVIVYVLAFFNTVHTLVFLERWWTSNTTADTTTRLTLAFEYSWRAARVSNLISIICCSLFCFSWSTAIVSTAVFLGCVIFVETISLLVFTPALIAFWSLSLQRFQQPCLGRATSRPRSVQKQNISLIWRRIIGHPWIRWFLIGIYAVGVCACGILMAAELKADEFQPIAWYTSNNYRQFNDAAKASFGNSDRDDSATVRIVWGLESTKRIGCHWFELECIGSSSYDSGFDLTSNTAQQQLIDFCDQLKSVDEVTALELKIRRQSTGSRTGLLRPLEINCFIQDMAAYYTSNPNVSLPIDYEDMKSILESTPSSYPPNVYSSCGFFPPYANTQSAKSCGVCDTYYRSFELGTLNWISDTGVAGPVPNIDKIVKLTGGTADPSLTNTNTGATDFAGFYGSTSKFAIVEVNVTFNSETIDAGIALDVAQAWDNYLQASMHSKSRPLQYPMQTTAEDRTWSWAKLKENILPDTILFMILSVIVALILFSLFSDNYVVGILATIIMIATSIFVLGIMGSKGWNIGLYEAVILTMIPPTESLLLSYYVCYYTYSDSEERMQRSSDAVMENGFAVITAAVLVFLAVIFLLASELQFYVEFGASFATIFALGTVGGSFVLPALLGIMGPEGEDYSLHSLSPWHNPRRLSLTETARKDGPFARRDTNAARPNLQADDDESVASDDITFVPPMASNKMAPVPPGATSPSKLPFPPRMPLPPGVPSHAAARN